MLEASADLATQPPTSTTCTPLPRKITLNSPRSTSFLSKSQTIAASMGECRAWMTTDTRTRSGNSSSRTTAPRWMDRGARSDFGRSHRGTAAASGTSPASLTTRQADRVVRAGSRRPDSAGVLRRTRPGAGEHDPGGLDRHERRLREGDPRSRPPGRDLLRQSS